jgi:cytoskeletal protein CcmA (bactofilin family)
MERPAEIGASIVIKGQVTAHEDIVISGRLEGSIKVDGYAVTVNAGAHLVADVDARAVVLAGKVLGAVCAVERIELRETADVEGEIEAPAIKMADGARFKGRAATTKKAKAGLQLAS